jgi:hypothetical protein
MSEAFVVPQTTQHSFKVETTEGTAPTDAASDSVLPNISPTIKGLSRNWVDRNLMVGHLGRLRPLDGGPADDLGWDVQVEARASGTLNTAPEIGQYLQCCFGKEAVGVNGTVQASPSPTTTGCTVSGATIVAGQVVDIQIAGGSTYEPRRILTESSGALTWWPPVSAPPGTGDTVRAGVSYILTSTQSEMKSGTGFWYFENGQKLVLAGGRGNAVFTLAIRNPMMIDFAMQSYVDPAASTAAIGYTWAPPDFEQVPPMILGIENRVYIPAEVAAGATTESVPLRFVSNDTSYFEVDTATDKLIVDYSGSGGWETKDFATWTYATQTATCTALSGAPSEGNSAYIQRTICVNDTLKFDAGHTFTRKDCISAASGWTGQGLTKRESTYEMSKYFQSFADYHMLKQADFMELWAIAGSTSGKKIALCAPYALRQDFSLDLGGEFATTSISGGAYSNSAAGNDEMFLGFL